MSRKISIGAKMIASFSKLKASCWFVPQLLLLVRSKRRHTTFKN